VSTHQRAAGSAEDQPSPVLAGRLGYLLKHAHLRFFELSTAALAPFGINGREAAVLTAIDEEDLLSQGEVARRMGVDRTTMVALIDELQVKGLVQRRQDPQDRRKNVVELTGAGHDTLSQATRAAAEAERIFLRPLAGDQAQEFKQALQALVFGTRPDPG
jgi:DNA-binding MarR family transcriptional regulator